MCDCIKTIGEKLKEKVLEVIENEIGFQGIKDSHFSHQTLVIERNGITTAPIMIPFIVKYNRKAKTSGNVREYKKEIKIRPSFCPFCGKEYSR